MAPKLTLVITRWPRFGANEWKIEWASRELPGQDDPVRRR